MLDGALITAWHEAAQELGIEVVAPYTLRLANGEVLEVEAFLPDFGGPRGAILVALKRHQLDRLAAESKHFAASLGESYRIFDDDLFRRTLDDWGWYGPETRRPAWYTGKPWEDPDD